MSRRPNLSGERGFSLPELLVAMFIGMIVLLAAFMVLDRSFTASGEIADRQEALQRGRQAMDLITRQLRSQVCLGTIKPVVSGTDSAITFYGDLSDGTQAIKRRTLSFDPLTDKITETVISGVGTYPALTFTGSGTTAPLLTKVKQIIDGTTPRAIFRYYAYQTGTTTGALEQLGTPLSATNLGRVAVIKVGFRAFADRNLTDNADATVLENDIYVRTAVAGQLQGSPECF